MRARGQDDFVREYIEAKMNQPVGRRGFLRLSGGVVVGTMAWARRRRFWPRAPQERRPRPPRPRRQALPLRAASAAAVRGASANIAGTTIDFLGLEARAVSTLHSRPSGSPTTR